MPSRMLKSRWNTASIGEAPEAGPAEHRLDQHRAAEQRADLQARDRHDRQQRIAQHVLEGDPAAGEALGLRGAHVVEAVDLEHRGAHQPRVDRHVEERQGHRGQQHVPADIDHAVEALVSRPDRLHARGRQPAEGDAEQQDEHQPDPEGRRRVGQQREDRDHRVGSGAHPPRRQHAQPHSQQDRQGERGQHQRQGRRQAFQDQPEDRPVVAVGVAEVELHDVPQIVAELDRQRLVEPVLLAQLGNVFGVRGARLARHHVDGVARREVQQREVEDDDPEDDRDHLQEAPPDDTNDAIHDWVKLASASLPRRRGRWRRHTASEGEGNGDGASHPLRRGLPRHLPRRRGREAELHML